MDGFDMTALAAMALLAFASAQAQPDLTPPPGRGVAPPPGGATAAPARGGRPPPGAVRPSPGGWGWHGGPRPGWWGPPPGFWGPRWSVGVTVGAPVVWGGAWGATWVGAWGSPWVGTWASPWPVWPGDWRVPGGWPVVTTAPIVVAPPPPTIVVQQPTLSSSAPAPSFWYYCTQPPGYFPYVQACEKPWMKVVPQAPGDSESPPRLAP